MPENKKATIIPVTNSIILDLLNSKIALFKLPSLILFSSLVATLSHIGFGFQVKYNLSLKTHSEQIAHVPVRIAAEDSLR